MGRRAFRGLGALGTDAHVTLAFEHLNESGLPDHGIGFVNSTADSARHFFQRPAQQDSAPPVLQLVRPLLSRLREGDPWTCRRSPSRYDLDEGGRVINQTANDRTSYQELDVSARFDTAPPLSPTEITRETNGRTDLDELFDNKTYAILPFEVWHIPNDLVTSLELSRETDRFQTAAGPNVVTGLNDPNVFAFYPGAITWSDPADQPARRCRLVALRHGQVHAAMGTDRRHALRSSQLELPRSRPGHPIQVRAHDDEASWRLALVYKPLPFASVYAGYGTSYNPTIQGVADGAWQRGAHRWNGELAARGGHRLRDRHEVGRARPEALADRRAFPHGQDEPRASRTRRTTPFLPSTA